MLEDVSVSDYPNEWGTWMTGGGKEGGGGLTELRH